MRSRSLVRRRAGAGQGATGTVEQAGEVRNAGIESLRAVAALAVLVSHVFAYSHGWQPVIFVGFLHRSIMGLGFSVFLFFALSGYLLFWPFVRRDFAGGDSVSLSRYTVNRAVRILPLYFAVLAILLIVNHDGGSLRQWLSFGTFTESFSTKTAQTVNGPMWSLAVEVHFYILLPLGAWLLARLSRGSLRWAAVLLIAAAIVSYLFRRHAFQPSVIWDYSLPGTFVFFVPGMLLALARVRLEGARPAWWRGLITRSDVWFAAGALVWLVVFWRYSLLGLAAIASGFIVAGCVLPMRAGVVSRTLSWRPLAYLGVASYSLYLWHVPIIEWIDGSSWEPQGFIPQLLIVAPLAIAVAAVSYWLIEAPPLRLRRQWARSAARQVR